MRMARVNITVPDGLLSRARGQLASTFPGSPPQRSPRSSTGSPKIAELDAYLAELDIELGPLGDQELTAAR